MESLLKNLEESVEKVDNDPTSQKDGTNKPEAKQVGKEGDALTISEMALMRSHFKQCWQIQSGNKNAEDLNIKIELTANADGTVKDAIIVDKSSYAQDAHFKSAADSALRAAKDPRCAQLPLPLEKYETWKNMILNFNPREMLGG